VEAGIAVATVGVEDPEGRPPPWRAGPVASHDHLRSLADDVASEADPRSTGQLEPDPGRLADGAGKARMQARRLEDREGDPRPSGEGSQPTESIGDRRPALDPLRQVDDEEVDRSAREQGAGDRDPLGDVRRGHDDEPLRLDSPRHRFDRIERLGEIQPRHDRAGRLGLRRESQGERRPAARQVAPERDAHPARQATRPEDRVERLEAGREHLRRVRLRFRHLEWHGRERADDLTARRSGRAPLRPQGREGRRHVRGECRHAWDYRTDVLMNQDPLAPSSSAHRGRRLLDEQLAGNVIEHDEPGRAGVVAWHAGGAIRCPEEPEQRHRPDPSVARDVGRARWPELGVVARDGRHDGWIQ
jgi:hypothetical protein